MNPRARDALRLAEATTTQVRERLTQTPTVALLPLGSTEAHGPHLPLCTDVLIAEGSALRAARRLDDRAIGALVLPALPYAVTEFVRGFAGTLSVRAATIAQLVEEIAAAVFEQGFALLVLVNGHLEPEHARMLKDTAARITASGAGRAIFPDQRRPPTVQQLGVEFAQGGGHAGGYETSLVLATRPELVDEAARAALPRNLVDLAARMRDGATTAAAAGGPDAWFGDPAAATAAEGERLLEVHATMIEQAVMAALAEYNP